MSGTKKCAHPACTCQVPAGQKYCGPKCEGSGKSLELTCQCDHPACNGAGLKS